VRDIELSEAALDAYLLLERHSRRSNLIRRSMIVGVDFIAFVRNSRINGCTLVVDICSLV
jgi:hypothetical protein